MMRKASVLCSLLLATGLAADGPSRPVQLSNDAADGARREIQRDRDDTQKWLRTDATSYLATIHRRDFDQKEVLSLGRSSDNDVRIDDPTVSAHHLRVSVIGDRFQVDAVDAEARFGVGKEMKRTALLEPYTIRVGRFVVRLSHQRFPALIVFDPMSPRFKEYKGFKYFPIDLAYRFELPLTPNPRAETVVIMSTRGSRRRAQRLGWFDFLVDGKACRLEAVRLLEPGVGETDISVFFRDATTGKTTYQLGRYVDVKPLANDRYLLDFNFAYNPACAVSDHYNCPIPPRANTLDVAIPAGEMDSHYH
jgi:uncharacterized protein (DUF1684 family)